MEHNLEDPLNLESSMGSVSYDFFLSFYSCWLNIYISLFILVDK